MPSGEQTYVDPSALRSLYVHDDRSVRFCAWRKKVGTLPLTRFGRAELMNSFAIAVHRKLIGHDDAANAAIDLNEDIRGGRLSIVDTLWRRTLDLSAELSARHTEKLGTRTLDVLHVATASALRMTHFVSYDKRQSALAKAIGFHVLAP